MGRDGRNSGNDFDLTLTVRFWEVSMILIFGGAYQGKSNFAKKTFGLSGSDISFCHEIKTAGADGDSSRPD